MGADGIFYLSVAEVIIGTRHRKDLGDVEGLARSIREIGLLHPIVVRPDRVLIAGARRLAAYKRLGLPEIPARVVDLDQVLCGELAENLCRKDFSPSELVAIGRAVQELEREKARERQVELGRSHGAPSGKFPEGSKGQTRDKVAATLGVSGRTYEKAAQIVQAADKEPERFGHLVEEMDRTGKVNGAYRKLRKAQEEERLLALDGAAQQLRGAAAANAAAPRASMTADAARSAEANPRSASSAPMRRRGMRGLTVWLHTTWIDALVRKGLLPQEERHDPQAIGAALIDLLLRALEEPREA
jgi:ParB-like chromosome segregation protein Spo0J